MTPTAAVHGPSIGPRPLLLAAGLGIVAVTVLAVLAAVLGDDRALAGVLVGGGVVIGVVVFGAGTLTVVGKVAPSMSLLVAMTTYALQVTVLMSLFVAYQRRPVLQRELADGWLAGGIVAATVAWTAGYLVAAFREPGLEVSETEVTASGPSAEAGDR